MTWMTRRRLALTLASASVAFWLSSSAGAFGQSSGSLGTSSFGSAAGGGGSGGGSSGGGGASSGGSTPGGGSGLGSSPFSGVTGGSGSSGGAGGSSLSSTNPFNSTASNPLYEGRPNQTISSSTSSNGTGTTSGASPPGGFGQPSFGAVTTTSTNTSSSSTLTTTAAPASTTRLAYSTRVKFPVKARPASQLQADLADVINRSSTLKNPANIKVLVDQDGTILLQGRAVDDEERRMVEAMLRLTPGVRVVKNELVVQ
jgi:hypothetical protein